MRMKCREKEAEMQCFDREMKQNFLMCRVHVTRLVAGCIGWLVLSFFLREIYLKSLHYQWCFTAFGMSVSPLIQNCSYVWLYVVAMLYIFE